MPRYPTYFTHGGRGYRYRGSEPGSQSSGPPRQTYDSDLRNAGRSETVTAEPMAWGHPHFAQPRGAPPPAPRNPQTVEASRTPTGEFQAARPAVNAGDLVDVAKMVAGMNPTIGLALDAYDALQDLKKMIHDGMFHPETVGLPDGYGNANYDLCFACGPVTYVHAGGNGNCAAYACDTWSAEPVGTPVADFTGGPAGAYIYKEFEAWHNYPFSYISRQRWVFVRRVAFTSFNTSLITYGAGAPPTPIGVPVAAWAGPMRKPVVTVTGNTAKNIWWAWKPSPFLVEQSMASYGPWYKPRRSPFIKALQDKELDVEVVLVENSTIRTNYKWEEARTKVRPDNAATYWLKGALSRITEVGDYIDAAFDALPEDCKKGRLVRDKVAALASCGNRIDPVQFIGNLIMNEIEDRAIAAGNKMKNKAVFDQGFYAPSAGTVFGGRTALGNIGV